jgi:hypothetical protein
MTRYRGPLLYAVAFILAAAGLALVRDALVIAAAILAGLTHVAQSQRPPPNPPRVA